MPPNGSNVFSALTPNGSSDPYNTANNRMVSSAGYDNSGNQTTLGSIVLQYDAENRQKQLTEGTLNITFGYDANGTRVTKQIAGGATTVYVHDAFGRMAAEYSTAAAPNYPCTTCYLSSDHLGSTRMITDQNANVVARHDFLPFGEEFPNGQYGRTGAAYGVTAGVRQMFTGQERDNESTPSGDFFNARYMSGVLQRFMSPDPYNAGADLTNPQSWNGYAYVGGNPLSAVDPSGMDPIIVPCTDCTVTVDGGSPGTVDTSGWLNSSELFAYGTGATFSMTGYYAPPRHPRPVSTPPSVALGPAKTGITSAQLQIILNAAKKDAGSCASAFSAGMIPYSLKFSLKAFDAQIQNAKYLQYPNPATSPLGPLSSVEAQALKGSIALYPNFFTDTSARQAGIVVHENLHTYTGWNDANVFYAFRQRGITPNEIKLFTSYGNTDGITTWILRGCK